MKVTGPKTNLKGKGSVCLTRDQEIDYLLKNSMVTDRGCWEWLGVLSEAGYGLCFRTVDGQKIYLMHRWSWAIHNGLIPPRAVIRHDCDNPSCVNPNHLRCGTSHDNYMDMRARGRERKVFGERHPHSRLTSEDVETIRSLVASGKQQKEVAKMFNTDPQYIWRIVHFKYRRNG